jgi:hypothetical protein
MEARQQRLSALRDELVQFHWQGRHSRPGSPERISVLQRLTPVLNEIFSLGEELEALPCSPAGPGASPIDGTDARRAVDWPRSRDVATASEFGQG